MIESVPIDSVRIDKRLGDLMNMRGVEGEYTDDAMKRSIEQRGMITPIVLDSSGVVIDGHRRLSIARELGHEAIRVIKCTE